jgi:hypothetical protein
MAALRQAADSLKEELLSAVTLTNAVQHVNVMSSRPPGATPSGEYEFAATLRWAIAANHSIA